MSSRIEDYALIGDCETAALVAKDGSIDWLCWPRFDSAACFAALLGEANNGRWQIAPAAAATATQVRRRYRRETLILETEFTDAEGGAVVVIDFMPLRNGRAAAAKPCEQRSGNARLSEEAGFAFAVSGIEAIALGTEQ